MNLIVCALNSSNPVPTRAPSASSSVSTVTTPLPPLSPVENPLKTNENSNNSTLRLQQGFRLYNGRLKPPTQDPRNGIMSASATAALSGSSPIKSTTEIDENFFDNKKNYTVAVARQEQSNNVIEQNGGARCEVFIFENLKGYLVQKTKSV